MLHRSIVKDKTMHASFSVPKLMLQVVHSVLISTFQSMCSYIIRSVTYTETKSRILPSQKGSLKNQSHITSLKSWHFSPVVSHVLSISLSAQTRAENSVQHCLGRHPHKVAAQEVSANTQTVKGTCLNLNWNTWMLKGSLWFPRNYHFTLFKERLYSATQGS